MDEERRWEDLGIDCLASIFQKVGLKHLILDIPLVCKPWYKASLIPSCWSVLDFPSVVDSVPVSSVTKLIKFGVTRSHGTATRVLLPSGYSMSDFVYIADTCPTVKVLSFPFNGELDFEDYTRHFAKLKELELLRTEADFSVNDSIAQIGMNCKNFVALLGGGYIGNKEAATMVSFMPNLKCLVQRGAYIPRDCLIHILKGCRNLTLLDVGECIGFDEHDEEISQLAQHIKIFKADGSKFYDDGSDLLNVGHYEDLVLNGSY